MREIKFWLGLGLIYMAVWVPVPLHKILYVLIQSVNVIVNNVMKINGQINNLRYIFVLFCIHSACSVCA
jgi:hypothetical protein